MKTFVSMLLALTLLLTACAQAPTPTEAPPPEETEAPMEAPTEAVEPPSPGDYTPPEGAMAPVPLSEGSQSTTPVAYKVGDPIKIAYMPPATEFNYYMAIGEGINSLAKEEGVETFMLAPQSGSDIATQMKMLQDVTTQDVDAIILSTHDENAAAPLVKQAVEMGIAVVIVNSDIASFPTAVNAVVGYSQRRGTFALGQYAAEMVDGTAKVGVLEGLPGYHSTERIGGFLDAFKEYPGMEIVASLPTAWNVETGNTSMMDLLQAHPEVELVVCANDYIAIGAAKAAEALGREDVLIFGNDGDTAGLEDIYNGVWTATVNTTPFVMGKVALQVALDVLNGAYPGGWTETPTVNTDAANSGSFLCQAQNLFPQPSKEYACEAMEVYAPPEGAMEPVPLSEGSQSTTPVAYKAGDPIKIAYMPPATEFNYYMAIGEGINSLAKEEGVETFMLAPQSGSDIATQMKMLQDVTTQDVDAIILSTHDENAAAPLVKQAVEMGIAVVIVNSDIASFPTAVNAVVGYSQRRGTFALGQYAAEMVDGTAKVGVLEGLPGYHSTERIGGFLDAFKEYPGMEIVASLPTAWNVETGNTSMMDLLQAHPEVELVVCANDYIAIGAAKAAEALGREDVLIFGNDGDTAGLEDIYNGVWTATVNTTPFVMGKVALQVALDVLNGAYPGGWTETPTVNTDAANSGSFLCQAQNLFPQPSKEYACEAMEVYAPPEGAMEPVPLSEGSQSTTPVAYKAGDPIKIAYMPPATEFNYYMAIGEGINSLAKEEGVETFMLAPQSGSDIATQMKMLQDVTTQDVDAIILSTHDENAAAPLVKLAVDMGIAVVIVNSDIASFPTAVNAVVGYSQRRGTFALGQYAAEMVDGTAKVGVLEGLPGYHSTERIGGFLDAFKEYPGMEIVASLPTAWNVETGNTAMMDLLQAHPEVELVVCANDYIAIGAAKAAEALGREDVLIFGNDGDTAGLEDIYNGVWTATVNTTPFVMGKVALQVALDVLNGVYPGGWTETPTVNTDQANSASFLCQANNLFPQPSVEYACP